MKKILNIADKGTKDALCILLILFAVATVIGKCVEPLQTVKAVEKNKAHYSRSQKFCSTTETTSQISLVDLGEFKLTAYCACETCCEQWADGITATGTTPVQGRTIAVDPSVIPYGSEVIINGHTYIAEDCGGAIKEKRIDVYFDNHDDALEFGVQHADVFLKVGDCA